jgi:putative transposase
MVEEAHQNGSRLRAACEVAGIDTRTLQRWKACAGLQNGDARPQAVRPVPAHALSAQERERILQVANEPRFAALSPTGILRPGGDRHVGASG